MDRPRTRPMTASLGQFVEEFRPTAANVAAGYILAGLCLVGAGTFLWYGAKAISETGGHMPVIAEKGACWFSLGMFGVFVICLVLGSYLLAAYAKSLAGRHVEFCTGGFRYVEGDFVEDVPWYEVDHIHEIIVYERPPLLKGPAILLIPKVANYSYQVTTKSEKSYSFDGNSVKNIKQFGTFLRQQAGAQGLNWKTTEQR